MKTRRLTKKEMWIFAIGQLGWSILSGIISAWLVAFYLPTKDKTNPVYFSDTTLNFYTLITPGLIIGGFLTILGLITALCRVWDAVSDPLVANLSDNSKNPKGRRFPFMKFAAIPFAVVTILIFICPSLISGGTEPTGWNVAWVAVMLVLFYTFMTIYCTPYNALISEFGKTQEDRMNISTYISLTFFAGTLIAYLPFVFSGIVRGFGVGYYWSYVICFIPLVIIACVSMLIPTLLLKETDFVEPKPAGTNAFKSLTTTFKNKNFLVFSGSDVMYFIGLTLFQTGLPFFVKVTMGLDESWTMYLLGGMTVLSAAFYPVVSKLVSKWGKKKLVIAGFLGLAVAYVLAALAYPITHNENSALSYLVGFGVVVIAAFPMALLGIIPQSIVADVAEQDSIVTGEKREGMFFAARTFAMKLGQSIAMLVFTSLAVIGADHVDTASNDISAHHIGVTIVAIVAVVFCLLGAAILFFYNEKKVMKTIADHQLEEGLITEAEEKELVGEEEAVDAPAEEATEVEEAKEEVTEE
ncbi:GPH family glycoside/pentoside/hexuronide:cation symporter [Anaeroplasma bactoclasticum]|jgi:GPH family glycoside/pentoside/hexuronide:cation symporter|uniref:GPH family glycoside/pentoside/hexuronide:cation symporter n=1 Tax=Anaeroplasma bactoclasticum TaxID=2088 RepID=A0A397RWI3_9MOLU|nr:MFS transporter [Anaeroplasma bactoclasticum]RIA78108.1 GPH family glycoside/pentoside/hexuronide:cation symporter [Anaeroplasma bactoclasticum]